MRDTRLMSMPPMREAMAPRVQPCAFSARAASRRTASYSASRERSSRSASVARSSRSSGRGTRASSDGSGKAATPWSLAPSSIVPSETARRCQPWQRVLPAPTEQGDLPGRGGPRPGHVGGPLPGRDVHPAALDPSTPRLLHERGNRDRTVPLAEGIGDVLGRVLKQVKEVGGVVSVAVLAVLGCARLRSRSQPPDGYSPSVFATTTRPAQREGAAP